MSFVAFCSDTCHNRNTPNKKKIRRTPQSSNAIQNLKISVFSVSSNLLLAITRKLNGEPSIFLLQNFFAT
jgi:hypothetical protein